MQRDMTGVTTVVGNQTLLPIMFDRSIYPCSECDLPTCLSELLCQEQVNACIPEWHYGVGCRTIHCRTPSICILGVRRLNLAWSPTCTAAGLQHWRSSRRSPVPGRTSARITISTNKVRAKMASCHTWGPPSSLWDRKDCKDRSLSIFCSRSERIILSWYVHVYDKHAHTMPPRGEAQSKTYLKEASAKYSLPPRAVVSSEGTGEGCEVGWRGISDLWQVQIGENCMRTFLQLYSSQEFLSRRTLFDSSVVPDLSQVFFACAPIYRVGLGSKDVRSAINRSASKKQLRMDGARRIETTS